jgi:hypothetical protein
MPASLDERLLENEFVSVRRTHGMTRLVRVVRTSVEIDSVEQIDQAWGSVSRVLTLIDKPSHVLLIDMRSARGRNDDEFERRVAPYRASTVHGFPRVAVLVKSVPGQLQVQRHVREDGLGEVQIFTSEQEAIDWLASVRPPSSAPERRASHRPGSRHPSSRPSGRPSSRPGSSRPGASRPKRSSKPPP